MKALFILAMTFSSATSMGHIRGHLHYPACMPPTDLQVCAERSDGFTRCTSKLTPTERGLSYRLDVPPGRYLVHAISESTAPGYRAYFSRAVTCGLRVRCDDHAPIPIEVKAGRTVHGIDPDDWFAPVEPLPLEPSA